MSTSVKYRTYVGMIAAAAVLAAFAVPNATAASENCFGVAASYLGTQGVMGAHSSSQTEPRAGIGNVAASNNLTVWDLGAFLLSLFTGGSVTCQ